MNKQTMQSLKAEIVDIQRLCTRYRVAFSISFDEASGLVKYIFGPVIWMLPPTEDFTVANLFEVAQRLAAEFPKSVTY